MRAALYVTAAFLSSSCASTPLPPKVAQISLISVEKGTVQQAEMMGDYYYNEYNVEGFIIQFRSDRTIPHGRDSDLDGFLSLDYYECNSESRYEKGHAYSARNYRRISSSKAELIENFPDGNVVYEAQLIADSLRWAKLPLCAQIFVSDNNIKRKVWQPAFISNPIKLIFPEGSP